MYKNIHMKKTITLKAITLLLTTATLLADALPSEANAGENAKKPTQHLVLPDITSEESAVKVFKETTALLKEKTKLDATELGEIHIITYSLEKAIAYFSENSEGVKKENADKMAVLIEEVHLNSETNKADKTKTALTSYFELADPFIKAL